MWAVSSPFPPRHFPARLRGPDRGSWSLSPSPSPVGRDYQGPFSIRCRRSPSQASTLGWDWDLLPPLTQYAIFLHQSCIQYRIYHLKYSSRGKNVEVGINSSLRSGSMWTVGLWNQSYAKNSFLDPMEADLCKNFILRSQLRIVLKPVESE